MAEDLHGADGLVAEHGARGRLGHVSLQDVQVGAADRRAVDPDDNVSRVDDRGIGVPSALAGAVVNESLHPAVLFVVGRGRSQSRVWRSGTPAIRDSPHLAWGKYRTPTIAAPATPISARAKRRATR